MQQGLAPAQASAFVPESGSISPQSFPAGEVDPNSTVAIGRDYSSTANVSRLIYSPIESQSLHSDLGNLSSVAISDSRKINEARDTTHIPLTRDVANHLFH